MIKFVSEIFHIIERKDKKRLIVILFLILISAFLDLVSVSTILPVVSMLSSPDPLVAIESNILLSFLSKLFNTVDPTKLSVISLITLVFIYAIKVAYSFLVLYVNTKFTQSFKRRLTTRLMAIYLSMPYEYHHANNSSTLIRKSTYDVDAFTDSVNGILNLTVYVATSLSIIIYLFISSWIVTLIVGGMLVLFAIFTLFVIRRRTKTYSRKIQELNNYNYKYLSQAFNGIKESKISNTESFFINQYARNIHSINQYTLKKTMIASIPSKTTEFIGIFGVALALLIIVLIGNEENYEIIQTFAVFVYAVLRLLPCVTGITTHINNFTYYSVSVDSISKDLEEIKKLEHSIDKVGNYQTMEFKNVISLKNISFAYSDDKERNIVSNVNFDIKKNSFIAISGKSGAGKTTLVDMILGLLKPTKGEILCDNQNINDNIRGWRDNLSYIPQNIFLMDDTIRNNVAFGVNPKLINDRDIWDALEKAQLSEFVKNSHKGLDTVIGERGIRLSGGQRQRIGIARAFYRNTNVIVFDEATSALDYETEKNILEHVSKYSDDHTLIIITHRLNTIEVCDYIYEIENGNVTCIKSRES